MESRTSRHSIRQFVDSLAAGTRVVWIANGTRGTIQPDKTILWDDGQHMAHKEMKDSHALLIHSEKERSFLQGVAGTGIGCLKTGCDLLRWDANACQEDVPERLCPLSVLSEPELPAVVGRRKHHFKAVRLTAS